MDTVLSWPPGSLGLAGTYRGFLFTWGTAVGLEMLRVCWEPRVLLYMDLLWLGVYGVPCSASEHPAIPLLGLLLWPPQLSTHLAWAGPKVTPG